MKFIIKTTEDEARALLRAAYDADNTALYTADERAVSGNCVTAIYKAEEGHVRLSSNVWTISLEDVIRDAGLEVPSAV